MKAVLVFSLTHVTLICFDNEVRLKKHISVTIAKSMISWNCSILLT